MGIIERFMNGSCWWDNFTRGWTAAISSMQRFLNGSFNPNDICLTQNMWTSIAIVLTFVNIFCTCTYSFVNVRGICYDWSFLGEPNSQTWSAVENPQHRRKRSGHQTMCSDPCLPIHFHLVCFHCCHVLHTCGGWIYVGTEWWGVGGRKGRCWD